MINIKYALFETESALFESVSGESVKKEIMIALCGIGAYQVQMIYPGISLRDYFYKVYLINNSDVISINYIHTDLPIPNDFPLEYQEMVFNTLEHFFDGAFIDTANIQAINHGLYDIAEEQNENEPKIVQPEPLLFAYNHYLSPIPRNESIDIDRMMDEVMDNDKNR